MSTTLCIDEHDRLSTPVHLQALHNPQQGSLVLHTVVDSAPADLARGLLKSIGFTRTTPGWPGRTPRALQLAGDWAYALQIRQVTIYGAWRLSQASLDWLADLQRDLGANVTLVTAGGFPNTERLRRAAQEEQPLQAVLGSASPLPQPRSEDENQLPLRLARSVAALPAAPMATFLAETAAVLEDRHDFANTVMTFNRIVYRIRSSLRSSPTHDTFCELLDELLATAQNVNDIIIGVRGAQAGALLAGLHVELDLQEICRIAYIRRHTNPHGHDTNTLMELGVDPRVPATAALAIATGTSSAALAALLVTDFDPATGALTLNGDTTAIPNHLVAPIRAQHRRQLRKGYIYLLAGSARTPSAPFIKRLLATHAPRAAAASTRDQALRAYKTAISCHSLQSANDDPTPDGSVCLHPDSLDRWVDALGQRGTQLNARYGPPIREGSERLDRFSSESHQVEALKTLSGVKERVGGPVGWKSQQTVAKDIQLLHAVIVQYGEKIRRGDLYRALGWTAKRTQTALAQLRRHLEPLGETITEEPPDYLIARAIDHTHAERALRVLRSRAQARDGLTAAAAEMLQKMVRVYPGRIAALPDEHPDAAAQAELCQADIASVTGGYVWLDNTVAMTFGNHTYHDGFQRRHDVG